MTEQVRNELDEKQMSRRLSMIMEMGEILLISGAEVSRVEDTITRLCRAYGFARADVFTITSSIVVTASAPGGEAYTQTRRIRERGTDLSKVEKINALSRRICAAPLELSELERKIAEIRSAKGTPQSLQFVMYVVISFALSVFFGGSWADGAASALSAWASSHLLQAQSRLSSSLRGVISGLGPFVPRGRAIMTRKPSPLTEEQGA